VTKHFHPLSKHFSLFLAIDKSRASRKHPLSLSHTRLIDKREPFVAVVVEGFMDDENKLNEYMSNEYNMIESSQNMNSQQQQGN